MGIIQRQGIKNTVISYSGILLGFFSLVVLQPILLSAEVIGLTRVLFSFSFLLASFAGLGIANITIRFFPLFKNHAQHHHGFLGFVLMFPMVGMFLTATLTYLFSEPFRALYQEKSALFNSFYFHSIPFAFFIALFIALTNYSMALFKSTVPSLLNDVVLRLLFIGLIVIYALDWISLHAFIIGYILIYASLCLALLVYIYQHDKPGLIPKGDIWTRSLIRQIFVFGAVFLLAGTASMGIKLLDTVILGQFIPLELVGVYSIAAFIPTFIEAPGNALDKIAGPRIADAMVRKQWAEIQKIYTLSSRYLFAIGAFLFLVVNLNIVDLLGFLPPIYGQGAEVVSILSLSALFNLVTGTNNAMVFNSDRFFIGVLVLIAIALCTIGLLYAFIPAAGIEGAAWAVCLSSLAYNSFKFLFIRIRFGMQPFSQSTLIIFVCLVLLYIIGLLLPLHFHPLINIPLRTVIIGSAFIWLMFKFGVLPNDFKKFNFSKFTNILK